MKAMKTRHADIVNQILAVYNDIEQDSKVTFNYT